MCACMHVCKEEQMEKSIAELGWSAMSMFLPRASGDGDIVA